MYNTFIPKIIHITQRHEIYREAIILNVVKNNIVNTFKVMRYRYYY